MAYREFIIACVSRIPYRDRDSIFFSPSVQNEITYTLWDYLTQIAARRPGGSGFSPAPGWYFKPNELKPHDVVVYFVRDRMSSIASRAGGVFNGDTQSAGYTSPTPHGIVSEVYVENNLPAKKLANIAFHELMHNKLDTGARWVPNIHTLGGIGASPANERSVLTTPNKQLMAQHMFKPVRQYTGGM